MVISKFTPYYILPEGRFNIFFHLFIYVLLRVVIKKEYIVKLNYLNMMLREG